ncbi:MAG TPA: site-2 protease family protein [Alphaproteobacteria bacterium]|jgi:Zn-dependent protease
MPALPSIDSLIIVAAVAIIAITFHEAAHGFVAYKLGDPTAYQQGRVSFNPIRHIDPFGTVVLPLLLFITSGWILGWAKPVPVNPSRLNSPRRDMILVAAAGPGINLALAFVSAALLSAIGGTAAEPEFLRRLLTFSIYFNVLIGVFNLIPIPPLDGGRIAVGLLPGSLAYPLQRLEPYGMWIVIGVLLIVPLVTYQLGSEINLFASLIQPVVNAIIGAIASLVGLGNSA